MWHQAPPEVRKSDLTQYRIMYVTFPQSELEMTDQHKHPGPVETAVEHDVKRALALLRRANFARRGAPPEMDTAGSGPGNKDGPRRFPLPLLTWKLGGGAPDLAPESALTAEREKPPVEG